MSAADTMRTCTWNLLAETRSTLPTRAARITWSVTIAALLEDRTESADRS